MPRKKKKESFEDWVSKSRSKEKKSEMQKEAQLEKTKHNLEYKDRPGEILQKYPKPEEPMQVKRPSLSQILFDRKKGKLLRESYEQQLKIHLNGKIEIYKDQIDKAIKSAVVYNEMLLESFKQVTIRYAEDLHNETQLELQQRDQNAMLQAAKELYSGLKEAHEKFGEIKLISDDLREKMIEKYSDTINNIMYTHLAFNEAGEPRWEKEK